MSTLPQRDRIQKTILNLALNRGADKTICPSEVARALAGPDETQWRPLMSPIREVAVELAQSGGIEIKKSGSVVDPSDFSGIYRIAIVDD